MIVLGIVLFGIFCASAAKGSEFQGVENDRMLTTPQLVYEWGYETEEHDVTTEDGYILSVFRVKRRNKRVPPGANVLLVFSGFICSSDHYLLMTEKPFLLDLVDDGYDVWLGNVRGTRYGKRHKILSATDVDFWDFSNHELGFYDVPATIDYILDVTANRKLGYLGYSQGGTSFFIMMSEKPEYNDKVAGMIVIAPAVHFNHSTNILGSFLALYGSQALESAKRTKFIEFLSLEGFFPDLLKFMCMNPRFFQSICRPIALQVMGAKSNGQNDDSFRRIFRYFASSAVKIAVHYAQFKSSGKFRQYMYDTEEENSRKYGSLEPPEYNLKNTRIPVVIIAAIGDRLTEYEDVEALANELPNVVNFVKFPYEYYGHFSAWGARNASKYCYKTIAPFLAKVSLD